MANKIMKKIYAFVKGSLVGFIAFCVLGLVAHLIMGTFCDTDTTSDLEHFSPPITLQEYENIYGCSPYSLENRFETAFCFSTPEPHKAYWDSSCADNPSGEAAGKMPYLAHPIATYSFIILCGVLGALPREDKMKAKK